MYEQFDFDVDSVGQIVHGRGHFPLPQQRLEVSELAFQCAQLTIEGFQERRQIARLRVRRVPPGPG